MIFISTYNINKTNKIIEIINTKLSKIRLLYIKEEDYRACDYIAVY